VFESACFCVSGVGVSAAVACDGDEDVADADGVRDLAGWGVADASGSRSKPTPESESESESELEDLCFS